MATMKRTLLPALAALVGLSGCAVSSAPVQQDATAVAPPPVQTPVQTPAGTAPPSATGAAPAAAADVLGRVRKGFAEPYRAKLSVTGACGDNSVGGRGTIAVQRVGGQLRSDLRAASPDLQFERVVRVGDDAWVVEEPGGDVERTTTRGLLSDDRVMFNGMTPDEQFEQAAAAIESTTPDAAETTLDGVRVRRHSATMAADAPARMGGRASGPVSVAYTFWVDGSGRLVKQTMVLTAACSITNESTLTYEPVPAINPPA